DAPPSKRGLYAGSGLLSGSLQRVGHHQSGGDLPDPFDPPQMVHSDALPQRKAHRQKNGDQRHGGAGPRPAAGEEGAAQARGARRQYKPFRLERTIPGTRTATASEERSKKGGRIARYRRYALLTEKAERRVLPVCRGVRPALFWKGPTDLGHL